MTSFRHPLQTSLRLARVTAFAVAVWTAVAMAQTPATAVQSKPADKPAEKAVETQPALPADAHVDQTIQLDGKPLKYTATVGTLPVYAGDGKKSADVVFTSYIVEGRDRPVTFALNGGPGAASVYLNLGAIGPKRVPFGDQGDSPSDAALVDNPGTWLDFTDLVFLDPVGTGFSRSYLNADDTKREFYGTENDIHYLSRVIYDWLLKNERLRSKKYLVGESYGGYRGPRITHYLQSQLGVAMNGVVLVSPYLNPTIDENGDLSPMAWIVTLPSMVAGLDEGFVRRAGGRIEIGAFLREVAREGGKIGSVYDSNVTSFDPFPFAPGQRSNDPLLESIIAPTTTAMVDFVTRVVGWKVNARYNALSYDVNRAWDSSSNALRTGAVPDLRQSIAADPKLRVLIAHGWNDLSCPFMASILTVDQMPEMGDSSRVQVHEYPGGHMFYSRPASRAAFKKDVQDMFAKH
jgi:carboxypeptidase C (cathepsin A)